MTGVMTDPRPDVMPDVMPYLRPDAMPYAMPDAVLPEQATEPLTAPATRRDRRRRDGERSDQRRTRAARDRTASEPSLWSYLRVSLSVAVLLALLALAAAVIAVPAATGSKPLTVLTSSMEPTLPPGTLLVVRPVDPADIRIGDVVTYQLHSGDPTVVTHRIIAVSKTAGGEYSFAFQGDNNSQPDPDQVREVQIQGRLWYSVPYIGWVSTWVNGEARSYIVPLLAGGLFAFAIWMVVSGLRDKARKRRRAAAGGKVSGRRRAGVPVA